MKKARFVLSKGRVLEQFEKMKGISDVVSYSSKTNPEVTPILEENTDCLFSVHAANELRHIRDRSRVLFLAQGWNEEFIQSLVGQGVFRFVVDNEQDLEVLLGFLEKNGVKIELMLRAKLKEHTLKTERFFVFGMPVETVNQRVKELKANPKISSLGVHFHRKTQNMAEWNLKYEVSGMFEEPTLHSIDVMNIGGGFPSKYANARVEVLESVFRRVRELREFLKEKGVKLMVEPGRFIAAPAVKLVTCISAVHGRNIIVNASVYNSNMDALIVPVKLLVEGELAKGKGKAFVVKGSTPCTMDIFRYRVYLKNPRAGDELVFLNAGAYNFSTDFCDLEKIETKIVD